MLKAPAQIGWSALYRSIDLVTPRRLKGEELLRRTRGWWTVEPDEIGPLVNKYGRLVLGENGELLVELPHRAAAEELQAALEERFADQVFLAH